MATAVCMETEEGIDEAERGKKGNLYEIVSIDAISDDVQIATLSNIYTRAEHFAVQAVYKGTVYFRTGDADRAVHNAKRLARTYEAANRCGAAQNTDYWQPFCEASPVYSYGATCARAIAQALGVSV